MKQFTTSTIVFLFIIGSFLALFQTLVPLYAEWFGPAEENIDAKLQAEQDAKLCYPHTVKIVDGILYCHCGKGQHQEPGKCK